MLDVHHIVQQIIIRWLKCSCDTSYRLKFLIHCFLQVSRSKCQLCAARISSPADLPVNPTFLSEQELHGMSPSCVLFALGLNKKPAVLHCGCTWCSPYRWNTCMLTHANTHHVMALLCAHCTSPQTDTLQGLDGTCYWPEMFVMLCGTERFLSHMRYRTVLL